MATGARNYGGQTNKIIIMVQSMFFASAASLGPSWQALFLFSCQEVLSEALQISHIRQRRDSVTSSSPLGPPYVAAKSQSV